MSRRRARYGAIEEGHLGNTYQVTFVGNRPKFVIARTPQGDVWKADVDVVRFGPNMQVPLGDVAADIMDASWCDAFWPGRTLPWRITAMTSMSGEPALVTMTPLFTSEGDKKIAVYEEKEGVPCPPPEEEAKQPKVLMGFGTFVNVKHGVRPQPGYGAGAVIGVSALALLGVSLIQNLNIRLG